MATQEIQGNTLGEKHRNYNQLVSESLETDGNLNDLNAADLDVNNLIKIDVAAKKRDVDYILKVLQSEDMLYVSRAIKLSSWLITDRQYSRIINPQYLHTNLFPKMMTKARAKFLLNIRIKLMDEDRVDAFYNYIKEDDEYAALKWLPHCSLSLTEKAVMKNHVILNYKKNCKLFKRLCEKSIRFLEICIKDCDYPGTNLQNTKFLIKNNPNIYLDFVETRAIYQVPSFGPRTTTTLMNAVPQRIIDKFEIYSRKIHLPTFARYLKIEQAQDLITKMSQKEETESWLKYDNLKHFVRYLPKEGRFNFLKKTIIQNENEDNMQTEDECNVQHSESTPLRGSANVYRFAPFEVAFAEHIKLIRAESAPTERVAIFDVLLSCAGRNMQHIQTILEYYSTKHMNEPFKFKTQFINTLLSKTDTYKYDITTWNILNNIFHSMEVYIESEKNVQTCVEAIIMHNVLNDENVPEIIQKKFKFQTMKSMQPKLTEKEKEKVFNFLYTFLEKKIKNKVVQSKIELMDAIKLLEEMQLLIMDWKKNLAEHPLFLSKLKELIKLNSSNTWEVDLSPLYRKFKKCRRVMFEDSLLLFPSNETCYNALKHNPELISQNKITAEKLFGDETTSTSQRRILTTLRVYWPQSLAAQWVVWYLTQLGHPTKAKIRGLCTLAPQQQVIEVVMKYVPSDFKISWSEDDQHLLSLRKYIAQNMHVSRPILPPEIILSYAKGDYLQFALPSLSAIFYNMSAAQAEQYMCKLLDAPVSLQKHGIRSAFTKLELQELKKIFDDIWKKPKHSSIRTVLFKKTYELLCRQTKPSVIEEAWLLLSNFIDDLSTDEKKIIYEILSKFEQVPMLVRGKFYMKSFKVLKSVPPHKLENCENNVQNLMWKMNNFIEHLDPDFVADVLLESVHKDFITKTYSCLDIMASYLLYAKDEKSQLERFRNFLLPLIESSFTLWDSDANVRCFVNLNITGLLQEIRKYFQRHVLEKKSIFPIKLFSSIQDELVKRLPFEKYYETLTTWKLFTTLVTFLKEHQDELDAIDTEPTEYEIEKNKADPYYYYNPQNEKKYNKIYMKAIPKFSKACLGFMKNDINKYFSSIYKMFVTCLQTIFENLNVLVQLECLKLLLEDESFVPSYLVVLEMLSQIHLYSGITDDDDDKERYRRTDEIREKIYLNPSVEVKFNYYQQYSRHD